jgi:hypothetical protein
MQLPVVLRAMQFPVLAMLWALLLAHGCSTDLAKNLQWVL